MRYLVASVAILGWLLVSAVAADADYLEVRRSVTLKQSPHRDAVVFRHLEPGQLLRLLDGEQTDGYYFAELPGHPPGWVYRTFVRRHAGPLPGDETADDGIVRICSFNIQWVGNSTIRDNEALASILDGYDIVVVQEVVSPPYPDVFPDGTAFNPDPESAAFFDEMVALGYSYVLSEEDTGTGDTIHRNGSTTEWWVAFYDPREIGLAGDLPHGFLADDRSDHPDYERVPYAFAFRTPGGEADFVLISVHLQPDSGPTKSERRRHELASIAAWVDGHDTDEQDFIIVGDMNVQDADELAEVVPAGYVSLNADCVATNTNPASPHPYDHVLYRPEHTAEMDTTFGFGVVDLVDAMRNLWRGPTPFPGDPYDRVAFRRYYSDHDPVEFRLLTAGRDDDD
jgi:hypothetical protein